MSHLYTVKQTADILGFSTNTVYKYLNEGYIKAARSNSKQGRFRITKLAIEEFLGEKLSDTSSKDKIEVNEPIEAVADSGDETAKEQISEVKRVERADHVQTQKLSPPLSVKAMRWLILVSLLLIIGDLFRSEGFSYWHQSVRLALISIFVLVAYQYGGVNNKNKGIKNYSE